MIDPTARGFYTVGVYEESGPNDAPNEALTSFTWTVTRANRPPVVAPPVDRTFRPGDSVDIAIAATDPDGNGLAFTSTDLPNWLVLDPATGRITGTVPADLADQSYPIDVSVSDGTDTTHATFTLSVAANPATPPAPALTLATDVSVVDEGGEVTLTGLRAAGGLLGRGHAPTLPPCVAFRLSGAVTTCPCRIRPQSPRSAE